MKTATAIITCKLAHSYVNAYKALYGPDVFNSQAKPKYLR